MYIHIGEIIKQTVQENKMDVTEFAKKINYTRRNVYKIFNKPSIETDVLVKISEALGENLFIRFLTNKEIAAYGHTKKKQVELWHALEEWKAALSVAVEEKKKEELKIQKRRELKARNKLKRRA
ncbi:MAG TPA: helix-turn-helix transcriptional regulator [Bacteroidia bacterium]|nr:helix-turn-helix transcriptional regulator [Bacteroidia bacterium]